MTYKVGVLGAGSFGTAMSRILGESSEVLIYARNPDVVENINLNHTHNGYDLPKTITATTDIEQIGIQCRLIFPIIPSEHFRSVMKAIAPYVGPGHIMIHGTKGLDISPDFHSAVSLNEIKKTVFSMSEVILQETSIIRVGALAGPNLAKEILAGQPAATVIASEFDEVIEKGINALSNPNFIVYGSHKLKGIELAGALKNMIALASGMMTGYGYGKNMQALLISRGLREIILIGKSVGAGVEAFLGTAGIGDLIATATSTNSRNYTLGHKISQGKSVAEALAEMKEVAEGYRTIKIAQSIVTAAAINAPVTKTIHAIVYEGSSIVTAFKKLIFNRLDTDVDFL